jgi:crooked neck
VKNRSAAPIQISSEQLLREARDRKIELEAHVPRQQITDKAELQEYRMRRRKEFEDQIRMQRQHLGNYVKYAKWEEEQQEFERARSIFERAVDVDYRNQSLWLKYSEMEMRNKFVNSARNVYDRAVQLLPRVDQFWYKYTYMEEMLGNFKLCRQVFKRWMEWEPDENAFASFAKFEMRRADEDAAREVYEKYVDVHPTLRAFLKYAKWEERQQQVAKARRVFERALVELPDEDERNSEKLFATLAQFEERQGEHERCRVVYKYALDRLGREEMPELYRNFIAFEKKHGSKEGIEDAIVGKRRLQYEDGVAAKPHDYDVWFDYVRLEEEEGDVERCRAVYERAVAQVPPVHEKRFWRRYVYLWINYALFEELQAKDYGRSREVYKALLTTIPHDAFSFAKAFTLAAQFEVRQKDLGAARKLFGQGIGRTGKLGKEKVFKDYIHLERQLGEVDRCRTLYSKYLEALPTNVGAWSKLAELETQLGETRRARAVFELAVSQPLLDMPELLWKQYIDFEIEVAQQGEEDDEEDEEGGGGGGGGEEGGGLGGQAGRVRELYERLLDRTKHVKVWISYASFESTGTLAPMQQAQQQDTDTSLLPGIGGGMEACRVVFRRAYAELKDQVMPEREKEEN